MKKKIEKKDKPMAEIEITDGTPLTGANLKERMQGRAFRIRKFTPRECLRLMDVDDCKIDRLMVTAEVTTKSGKATTKRVLSDCALYKLAGNSIVVACMEAMFESLFFPTAEDLRGEQLSLFD